MATLDISVAYFFVPVGLGIFMTALHLTRIAFTAPPLKKSGEAE
jgi:hypothetical protein